MNQPARYKRKWTLADDQPIEAHASLLHDEQNRAGEMLAARLLESPHGQVVIASLKIEERERVHGTEYKLELASMPLAELLESAGLKLPTATLDRLQEILHL